MDQQNERPGTSATSQAPIPHAVIVNPHGAGVTTNIKLYRHAAGYKTVNFFGLFLLDYLSTVVYSSPLTFLFVPPFSFLL